MARYDKYDPISGGFRARLNANLTLTSGAYIGAVSLNSSGRVVTGTAGQSGMVGVLVKNAARTPDGTPNPNAPIGAMAGDVVDIMTDGEIVDLDTTAFPAGSAIYAAANGVLSTTNTGTKVGWTVEAGRLIVRIAG